MNGIDRRTLLKAGAVAGIATAAPAVAALRRPARVVMFDSRIAESLAFASTAGGDQAIDLYREHHSHFARLRAGQHPGVVEGLTGWSDWVVVRGELEAQGYRVTAEQKVRAPSSGKAHLFRWSMKAR